MIKIKPAEEDHLEQSEPIGMVISSEPKVKQQAKRTRLETLDLMQRVALGEALFAVCDEVKRLKGVEPSIAYPTELPVRFLAQDEWRLVCKEVGPGRIKVIFHWDPTAFKSIGLEEGNFHLSPESMERIENALNDLTDYHNAYITEKLSVTPRGK